MEVIVRNLPDQLTEKQVDNFFRGVLEKLGIHTYFCQKLKGRGCATITILDAMKARKFLSVHGQTDPGSRGYAKVQLKLQHKGRQIYCSRSNKDPDEHILLSLKKEESDRYGLQIRKAKIVPAKVEDSNSKSAKPRAWSISELLCGQWTYDGPDLMFASYFREVRKGRVVFGQRTLRINLDPQGRNNPKHQIEIPYNSIQSFTTGHKANPCITLSLSEAPRFFEQLEDDSTGVSDMQRMLQAMAISSNSAAAMQAQKMLRDIRIRDPTPQYKRKRINALNSIHQEVVASCLCYRLVLLNANDIAGIIALKRFPMIPGSISWSTSITQRPPFTRQMTALKAALTEGTYSILPFGLKFQLQKLAQNGYLSPTAVLGLLSAVYRHLQEANVAVVIQSVRNLFGWIPFAGPDVESSELSLETLMEFLDQAKISILREKSYSNGLADRYEHIASIQKAMVTPAGVYLYGPEPEVVNRVLRKYSAFSDHFLSVSFLEEDGEPLRLDRQTSGEEIYHGRYKSVLQTGINIANRQYEFLGFSHSSLRSQTCWFMAPFVLDETLIFAQNVIRSLGDFSLIRSPAKCAARIGQAFSQTLSSVQIAPAAFQTMPDIERNGRTFSDGVGTCSSEVLQEIWSKYTQARKLKPTVLQIRYQGAKGVISLDTRLEGAALRLRPSMIKFEGTNVADIEICGAANKPLPMYLNRQLIKILEDLDVPPESFMNLQATAVENLRFTTTSAINASNFLRRNFIGKVARLPWLTRKLWSMGYSFTDDSFLRDTLELAVLIQLREIKYRSRILVENGVTLYGIMDETDFLQENEIYCSMHTETGGQIITGSVVITRSPALHPGDVQCVTAVKVPSDSPLKALHNVVVFSSHGERDLPSQLSGGDLDGDLYNIIYDSSLYPKKLSLPADYPTPRAVDIGRSVERSDITEFFVRFMENDNLGMIATLHQILADMRSAGTFNHECIELAGSHSTAVDFSKTGIPVESKTLPKYPKARPDFQAPGPRVLIEKTIKFDEEDIEEPPQDTNDELDELESYEPSKIRYYESPKALGKLYRDIDERVFLQQIQAQSHSKGPLGGHDLLSVVWNYVRDRTALIQWDHCLEFAKDVKDNYEENLADTMLEYSNHPPHFVSEVEVFSGNLLGRNGGQSKRQREFSKTMKEKHERDTEYTVHSITRGDDGKRGEEALERSIACLYVAANTEKIHKRVGKLVSFAWIAAAVCLKEVEKLAGSEKLLT